MHYRPSGDTTPSNEDVAITHAMSREGGAVGTPLLAHVIVARCSSSMLELGMLGS